MRKADTFMVSIVAGVALCGCAAIGIPATNDPDKKIRYAYILFDQQQRPLPAERLIREAIAIYREQNDEHGLAQAYRAYGFFFRSAAIKKWSGFYESNDFLEPGATYADRYQKSIEYFEKSAVILEKLKEYGTLTNVHLNAGFTYEFANEPEKACDEYNKSLDSHQRRMKQHPGAAVVVPEGFDSYEAYLTAFLVRLECPT